MSQLCTLCNDEVSFDDTDFTKPKGFIFNEKPFCHKCLDAVYFANDLDTTVLEPSKVKKDPTSSKSSKNTCSVCNKLYSGVKCSCGEVNPLLFRVGKKKKKKRGKQ